MGYAESTIYQHINNANLFIKWLKNKNIKPKDCDYAKLIVFMNDMITIWSGISTNKSPINRLMVAVSLYYDYLSSLDNTIKNPAKFIRLKCKRKYQLKKLMRYDELLALYHYKKPSTPRTIRNQVILGFLICQGLTTGELHRIKLQHIKLREGKIYIPSDHSNKWKKGLNARELDLRAFQMVDLIEYLNNVRPGILTGEFLKTPGRKPLKENQVKNTNQLLLSMGGSLNIKNSQCHLFRNLKRINSRIQNSHQIRQSVIAYWLQEYNLKAVQYMAGHRYVSSTEKYKKDNLEELHREVLKYHPLK